MVLLSFELRSLKPLNRASEKSHKNRLVIALVEFHKAQCYFSTVIQVAALALYHKNNQVINSGKLPAKGDYPHLFDASVMIVLASSGLLPISLALACITRYGRQSWYLLVLSWVTVIMATATLSASSHWAKKWGNGSQLFDNNMDNFFVINYSNSGSSRSGPNSCEPGVTYVSEAVAPLCGNSELLSNALPYVMTDSWLTWLIWAHCIIWMLFCIGKKSNDDNRLIIFRDLTRSVLLKRPWIQFIAKESRAWWTWVIISVVPWTLCFAMQFHLFNAYFKHDVISYNWSFGQIIAVFVWVPSIVEYIYMLISKYLTSRVVLWVLINGSRWHPESIEL